MSPRTLPFLFCETGACRKRGKIMNLKAMSKIVFQGLCALGLIIGAMIAHAGIASAQVACDGAQDHWVTVNVPGTDPVQTVEVNRKHIFCGEVKKKKAKGFHSRPGGDNPETVDTSTAGITQYRVVVDGVEVATGLYNLTNFDITDNGVTAVKAISTMFPDHCSYNDVLTAIANASNGDDSGPTCRTLQGADFPIQVYYLGDGRINTAFPIVP
ncbi:EndoU domain-containing protein [Kiloniella majae]|uniref:EndoU domain-containing protein n=1 Tax=Kiloniella majae TaxID=1938558 RepID=UPI000A277875|nr:EndoU domain-containing protein [Kiloniella majae]